jgi:membrane protease subunit (stomatin/prohibitin family)
MPLMEVIESVDNYPSQMIERIPEAGDGEIKWGAQLTVRDNQWAIFYRDGRAMEVFEGGRHVLTTQNIPVLTKFVTQFGYGEDSPFRSDVLFVQRKIFTDIKWGTSDPIVFRDPEFQMMRLRSFGACSVRVRDPLLFVNNLVGAQGYYDISEISGYLRQIISSSLAQILGSLVTSVLELPQKYLIIADAVRTRAQENLDLLGLELVQLVVNAINPPASVQELMDKKSAMAVIGDMQQFMQFQTATAIEKAAENTGGAASDGVGIGAGLGLGLVMPQAITSALGGSNPQTSGNQSGAEGSISERLKQLKGLLESELIDQDTYEEKRDEIIASL